MANKNQNKTENQNGVIQLADLMEQSQDAMETIRNVLKILKNTVIYHEKAAKAATTEK